MEPYFPPALLILFFFFFLGDDRSKSMQIVALVHSDLHDERTLASLRYMASSLVQISVGDKGEARQHCQITHKKKKGKVTKSVRKCKT